MLVLVIVIIAGVICAQFFFFKKNLDRMNLFANIFNAKDSWQVTTNSVTGSVSGIQGDGNEVFGSIKNNINEYLSHSQGSVIDYNILKDSVDRNCETIEDQINAQMPVPLYCGLAGTMAGVILGLWSLLGEGSVKSLMSSGSQSIAQATSAMTGAANGINDLLAGVAFAMVASIFGIILTTINSVRFKGYKDKEEKGKNAFLSWMQSVLLPKLPNDISDAFTRLVRNLDNFNNTFKSNTAGLGRTLEKINTSYSIQADIVETIQKMDVAKMATANVRVLKELKGCTDELEQFNYYLNSIHGYTMEIESFRKQLNSEGSMVALLLQIKSAMESIKDFFHEELGQINQRKLAIGQSVDRVDDFITKSLDRLNKSSVTSVDELKKNIQQQAEGIQDYLEQEEKLLHDTAQDVRVKFEEQIKLVPTIANRLDDISKIPAQIDKASSNIAASNQKLASNIADSNKKLSSGIERANHDLAQSIEHTINKLIMNGGGEGNGTSVSYMPTWLKIVVVVLLLAIACACATTAWFNYNRYKVEVEQKQQSPQQNTATDSTFVPTAGVNQVDTSKVQ